MKVLTKKFTILYLIRVENKDRRMVYMNLEVYIPEGASHDVKTVGWNL